MTEHSLAPPRTGSLVVLLRYCEDKVWQRLQALLDEDGLAPEHWRIMALLLDQPGLGAGAIVEGAVLPSASVTRHVDRLVENGIVIRTLDPTDRRRVVLALSSRGRERAERLRAAERGVQETIAAALGAERLHALEHDLGVLPSLLDESGA